MYMMYDVVMIHRCLALCHTVIPERVPPGGRRRGSLQIHAKVQEEDEPPDATNGNGNGDSIKAAKQGLYTDICIRAVDCLDPCCSSLSVA